VSKFPAELLDLVFKKIEWHSGLQYIKLHKKEIDDPSPVFHFKLDENNIQLNYDEKNCILSAKEHTKLSHFYYKVDINPFITNNLEEFDTLSEYIHYQLKDLFVDQAKIHFGFEVTHFRIKGEHIWIVFTKNPDPNGIDYEVYTEYEVPVTDRLQKKQILALRYLLEACMMQGVQLVNDAAGNDYDKPLDINQVCCLSYIKSTSPSSKRQTVKYDPDVPLPTNSDFKIIGEVITFISELVHKTVETYNKHLID
jgi:hypothetical protein